MPLPNVNGWIIDYRTAIALFDAQNGARVNHCVTQCHIGQFKFCHFEKASFASNDVLAQCFLGQPSCTLVPKAEYMQSWETIASAQTPKRPLAGNKHSALTTAIALVENFGVITDHVNDRFMTTRDYCLMWNVNVLTLNEYFGNL